MKRKKEQTKRKLPLQSIAFACTVLAAALAGAWFLFPKEMHKVIQTLPEQIRPGAEESSAPQDDWWKDDQDTVLTEELVNTGGAAQQKNTDAGVATTESASSPVAESDQDAAAATEAGNSNAEKEQEQKPHKAQSCAIAAGKLNNFLKSLDEKEYIQAFQLKQPVRQHFEKLEKKLAAKTPTVIRETDDLYTVLSNTAHFFRVVGKDNIQLVKAVLEQEQGNLEETADDLYSTSTSGQCPADTVQVPFNTAYEYAVFFLNTIGGRSYLFRRAAKVRLLASYYALLVVDEANQRNLNTHGLDISSLIPLLIREIEANNQLARKDEYLARLHELAAQYPVR